MGENGNLGSEGDGDQRVSGIPSKAVQKRPGTKKMSALVREFESLYLKKEIRICAPARTLDKIIEARIKGRVFLLRRRVNCGKGCGGCPHGPYWYGFYRGKERVHSFYLGRELPPRFRDAERVKISEVVYGDGKSRERGGDKNG